MIFETGSLTGLALSNLARLASEAYSSCLGLSSAGITYIPDCPEQSTGLCAEVRSPCLPHCPISSLLLLLRQILSRQAREGRFTLVGALC